MTANLNPRVYWLGALLILLVAGGLRLHYAGTREALWRDELFELAVGAETESIAECLAIVREDGQSPLHYLVTRGVDRAFGRAFLLQRWHVFAASWLAVLALMLLARHWFGPRCSLLCGLFAATSPILIFYSAELRGYALYSLLTLVYFGVYFEFRQRRTRGWAMAWGAAAALLAYSHYFGLFFILVSGVLSLFDQHYRRSALHALLAGAAFLICMSPWLPALVEALLSGKQHWASGSADFARVTSPARIVLEKSGRYLVWSGIGLGALVFALGRWPDRERRIFTALLISIFGSALVAWLVQLQGNRGLITRYFIGHTTLLLPPALLYWSRVGTLGEVAVWRGLKTGRVYRVGPRVHATIGVVFIAVTWILQVQDPKGWVRKRVTPHEPARAWIESRRGEGDLIVASPGFMAEAFRYHCRGSFEVIPVPPVFGESSIHGPVRADPAELERAWEEFSKRVTSHLQAGRGVWYYTLSSRGTHPIPDDGRRGWDKPPAWLTDRGIERRRLHKSLIESLEANGERVLLRKWIRDEFRIPCRLMLYRDDSQASNARLRSKPQR
ncbi:MAG: hypothetical protein ACYS0F_04500 [Planctomycetota bacterium]|jgi:hypothetical protein